MKTSMVIKDAIWSQFGAALMMLENAIDMCPDEHWDASSRIWYHAYHCVFWTDYYLTLNPSQFTPPEPYTLSEFDPSGVMPDRIYTKKELVAYLNFCESKANQLIFSRSEDQWSQSYKKGNKNFSVIELLIYNLRHIQHHAAQISMLLRQNIDSAPKWVSQAKKHTLND